MKKIFAITLMLVMMMSCAESKEFVIDGKKTTVEPYGWFDLEKKNDSIEYRINPGNIILDVVFIETVFIPVILTGDQFYEPVRKK